jgi:predicted helicase
VLDPAAGTGTFLHAALRAVHARFAGNEGLWDAYVADHLLPRVHGFELLMAPYTVAHLKLGLFLQETGYTFSRDERLSVFLTNALDDAGRAGERPIPFARWLAEEAEAAGRVKRDVPVMVVLGNPPYSGHSPNTGEWITRLMRGEDTQTGRPTESYFEVDGEPLGEKNPKWLNDDYVKFIRMAQEQIARTGQGVLAFVTNHGFLDNPTFRGMRQSLMAAFDRLYVLDLHGNAKKETAPGGGRDENVFDIMQGVAISVFVRLGDHADGPAEVYHADLWGFRYDKYAALSTADVTTTRWVRLYPRAPNYLFR